MKNILVSACLLGENVRYNAEVVEVSQQIKKLADEYNIIPVCPEVLGGLDVPREPCEIRGEGGGRAVIEGRAKVLGDKGTDCTDAFVKGAEKALAAALEHNAEFAVLKQRSPSCGSSIIYTGDFSGRKKQGEGVATAMLRMNDIKVISEEDI